MSYRQVIKALWRDHPVAQTSFLLALAITRFFTAWLISSALYWHNPEHFLSGFAAVDDHRLHRPQSATA